jgi:hypothetical protein
MTSIKPTTVKLTNIGRDAVYNQKVSTDILGIRTIGIELFDNSKLCTMLEVYCH